MAAATESMIKENHVCALLLLGLGFLGVQLLGLSDCDVGVSLRVICGWVAFISLAPRVRWVRAGGVKPS